MYSSIIEKALHEINTRYAENVTNLVLDGKIQRCGKKDHVWYVGNEWTYNGQVYQSVKYGSWKQAGEYLVKSWDSEIESNKNWRKKYQDHTREAKAALDLTRQEKQEKCRLKWTPIFNNAAKGTIDHDYLKLKGVTELYTAKNPSGTVLLIPAYNSVKGMVGVQRIFKDLDPESKEYGQWVKKFSAGIEIKGAFCPLKPFRDSEYCYVAEGFATAASIQLAFPKVPVICVFNAGNILPAIEHIRAINQKIKIMVAADRDQPDKKGEKAGEKYASLAAKRFSGVCFRIVKFETNNPSWTDFNDLHQFESLDRVKEQLAIDPAEFTEILCLGYKGDQYFYTSTENPQIITLSANSHTKGNLTGLVDLPYWYKNFGMQDEDGNYVGVKWLEAESTLKARCRNAGFFDPEKMRGRGVWSDGGRIVVNTGEQLYEDGKPVSRLETQYHYLRTKEIPFRIGNSFNTDEMQQLLAVFGSLSIKGKQGFIYLAGWVVQAQIFAVLPWRFHIWISGDRGSGKSTVQSWAGDLLIRPSLNLNSSAAGIRQDIQSDTIPVIYDESEPDNNRLKEIIELARATNSNNGFDTKRGTPSGKAIVYNTQTCFCMGSIQKGIEKSADISRFFVIEISKDENQTIDEYEEMVNRIHHFTKNKQRLFSRAVENAPTILKSFKVAQRFFREKRIESRLADQLASLCACFWLYFSTETITVNQLEYLVKEFELLKSEYVQANETNDAQDCYDSLMSMKVDNMNNSVFQCINEIHYAASSQVSDQWEKILGAMGMRYYPAKKELLVANKSFEIQKRLPDFRDYASIFRRDKNIFVRDDRQRIVNYQSNARAIVIRVTL
jgi:phage/plasmid primase-like uncharacterized protein